MQRSRPSMISCLMVKMSVIQLGKANTMNQSANLSIEERVAALEAAVANLQQRSAQNHNWVEQLSGSFKDEPEFEAVLAYGRAIRQGDDSLLGFVDES
jgi:hypothetical protein